MATGIEIAGLILGVLPFFIAAIEDYNDGLIPAKAFFGRERQLPELSRKLRQEYVQYDLTMRKLVGSITDDSEYSEMTSDWTSELWKSPRTERRLQDRLGECYAAYRSTVEEIQIAMDKIAGKLEIERFHKVNHL